MRRFSARHRGAYHQAVAPDARRVCFHAPSTHAAAMRGILGVAGTERGASPDRVDAMVIRRSLSLAKSHHDRSQPVSWLADPPSDAAFSSHVRQWLARASTVPAYSGAPASARFPARGFSYTGAGQAGTYVRFHKSAVARAQEPSANLGRSRHCKREAVRRHCASGKAPNTWQ